VNATAAPSRKRLDQFLRIACEHEFSNYGSTLVKLGPTHVPAAHFAQRQPNIQPTLTIGRGFPVSVIVTLDLARVPDGKRGTL
jgi:hypothetical protein